jgi:AraC-like DNA-binding protein
MDRMLLLDTVMRMLAIGQLLLIAFVIGRGAAPRALRLTTMALLLGVSAYLTITTPLFRPVRGPFWATIQLAAQAVPLLLWVFTHQLFERRIDRRVVVAAVIVLIGCWSCFYLLALWMPETLIWNARVQRLSSLLLIGHAILIALRERGDDLIEKRRRLRVGFVVVVGALAFVVIVLELILGFHRGSDIALGQAFAILVATTAMGVALLQSDPDLLFDPARAAPPPSLSPVEHVLNGKLDTALADAIYRAPGLTIGVLADRLGTPEHRLRSLINQRLGYRNFSAFLNHYRISEAKALLADPARVDLPILTMAMDLGYGSLAPFNRAFREETGQTPSEFRRATIVPV